MNTTLATQLSTFTNRELGIHTKEIRGFMNRARTEKSKIHWMSQLRICETEMIKRMDSLAA